MNVISASGGLVHTVKITGYSSGGEGIARLSDGRVVFVHRAAKDDLLEIAITKEQQRSAHAEIINILSPSKQRIVPDCRFYLKCGGCDFRHITYEEELESKLKRVNDALSRIGGISAQVSEILHTGQIDGYRNKAVFHFDGDAIGFYHAKSHRVVPISYCKLLPDDINSALKSLTAAMATASDMTNIADLSGIDCIAEMTGSASKASKDEVTIRSGRNGLKLPLEEELDGLVFRISGFFQVNTEAALLLYNKVREYASLKKSESLLDLYCGVGTLTIFVGRDAGYALGVEKNSAAVKTARENAAQNGMSHVEFIASDAGSPTMGFKNPDCIIVDPPRKGLSGSVIDMLLELSPSRIVYVSCDPATLARDIHALKGFCVKDICAVDMFPRTANVECCCVLTK